MISLLMSVCGGKERVGIFNFDGICVFWSISSISLFLWKSFHWALLICSVKNLNSFFSISSVHCGVGTKFRPWFSRISWLSDIFIVDLLSTFSLAELIRLFNFLNFCLDLYLFLSYLFLFFSFLLFWLWKFFLLVFCLFLSQLNLFM